LDFHEIWLIGRLCTRKELIKFWKWYSIYSGYYSKFTSLSTVDCDSRCYKISSDAATST